MNLINVGVMCGLSKHEKGITVARRTITGVASGLLQLLNSLECQEL